MIHVLNPVDWMSTVGTEIVSEIVERGGSEEVGRDGIRIHGYRSYIHLEDALYSNSPRILLLNYLEASYRRIVNSVEPVFSSLRPVCIM